MSDYTPTTDEIRRGYIGEPDHFMDPLVAAEFDRWHRETRAAEVMAFAVRCLPIDLYRRAQQWADNIRNEGNDHGVSD
jgi:hypothetical protein